MAEGLVIAHNPEALTWEEQQKIFDTLKGPDLHRFKIPPRKVLSDDCPVVIGRVIEDGAITDPGQTYYPHTGEYVWVLPTGSLQTYFELARFRAFQSKEGDDPFAGLLDLEQRFKDLAVSLAEVIVWWDWTNVVGEPLSQPYRNPAVLQSLETDELMWLLGAAQGETTGERKNGSPPSATTSSGAGRPPRKSR